MSSELADLKRLTLMIERLVDAELLSDADGAVLLAEADAARCSLSKADVDAVRKHLAQVAQITEALIQGGSLSARDGHPQIEAAADLLASLSEVRSNPFA